MEWNQPPLKGLGAYERRQALYVLKLRSTPQFEKVLEMLDRGKTVWATTAWFMEQADRGDLSDCSFETARKYINALKLRLEAISAKVPRINFAELRQAAVNPYQHTRATAAILGVPEPTPSDIDKALTEEILNADAVKMLKYCFAIQKERVKELRLFEKKTGVPVPFGDKTVQVLKQISQEVGRMEIGIAMLRSRNAWGATPIDVAHETKFSPVVEEIAKLDPVDKNLIRDARDKVIALLEEESGSGYYSHGLETDGGGTETPPREDNP